MGNVAGVIGKNVARKARRFNIENRTERFLEKRVKVVAPRPKATELEVEKLNREMPDLMGSIHERNTQLLDRLKDVYVSSSDKPLKSPLRQENPNRPLPVGRTTTRDPYGYIEPSTVSPGRITLRQAIRLLSQHQVDKKTNSIQSLAAEYNMSEEDVGNIVENFKVFTLVDSEKRTSSIGLNARDITEPNTPDSVNLISYASTITKMNKQLQARSDGEKQKQDGKIEQVIKEENKK